jgi:hypothetical protein
MSMRKKSLPQHKHVEIKTELHVVARDTGERDLSHVVMKDCKSAGLFGLVR